jgi:predicted AAA+ superfamily ATPase
MGQNNAFGDTEISGKSSLEVRNVAKAIVRGGWPISVVNPSEDISSQATNYIESVIDSDISRVDGIEKNPKRVRLLLRSLARNESTEAAMTTLKADMISDEGGLSTNTIAQYLNALRRLYILEEEEAWAPAVRSKVAIRTSPIRRYCDPSLAAALLRLTPEKLVVDYNTFGLLFESLCVRDLRCYAGANDANVYHYRDARDLECDVIIECGNGNWGAIEIKLESNRIEQAVTSLLKIKDEVRSQHGGEAKFLMVIVSQGYAYRRDDGIYIVPISCLRP